MKGGRKKEKVAVKNEEYEVEDIVAHKKERSFDFFKVRWKGFEESDDTWEVEANLAHAPMFHAKMQELKKATEQKMKDEEAEAAAQAHAKKRRRRTSSESDPSRPHGVDTPEEEEECEYRVYATGTKVPKNHLPDEVALGTRLKILRFKRSVPAGIRMSAEGGSLEEGQEISVTYSIDGTDTYTIPFNAARRYCCQRLLSYLIRRTTFRNSRGARETAAQGSTAYEGSGRPQSPASEGSVQQETASEHAESAEKRGLCGEGCGKDKNGENEQECSATGLGTRDSSKAAVYLHDIELKRNASIVNAAAQSSSDPRTASKLGLVDGV